MKPKKLVVLSGPSGAGKTTLLHEMCQSMNFVQAVSYTTRAMRAGEVDGVDYHFITKDVFKKMDDAGLFIETTHIFGHFYATPVSITDSDVSTVIDVDLNGVKAFQKNAVDATYVLIMPPNKAILRERLLAREQNALSLDSRVNSYDMYEQNHDLFSECLINTTVSELFERMSQFLNSN